MNSADAEPVPGVGNSVPPPPSSPSPRGQNGEGWRAWVASPIALLPLLLIGAVAGVLLYASHLHNFGASFWGIYYNFIPNHAGSSWGIGTYVLGSALTAGLSLILATVLSLALSISIVAYLPSIPGRILTIVTNLLAGIPSVVVGIWGFVIVGPYFGLTVEPALRDVLFWLPGFGGTTSDIGAWGILLAVFLLMVMIIPLTTALMREALSNVPRELVDAGLALGSTRWEVTRRVRMHYARLGLWSAILLGFGRAVGESVAVAMVIGGVPKVPGSLYAQSTTMAAFIFYQLDSALVLPDLLTFLVEIALVLLLITIAVNILAQILSRSEVAISTTLGAEVRR